MDINQLQKEIDCDKDYYTILGIKPDVHHSAIKPAYNKLLLLWHPDKWSVDKLFPPDNTSLSLEDVQAHFNEVHDAYEVLINSEKRSFYNAVRSGKLLIKPSPVAELERRRNLSLPDYYARLGLPNSWVTIDDIIDAYRRLSTVWDLYCWDKDRRYAADIKEVVNFSEGTEWGVDSYGCRLYPENAIALTQREVEARADEFEEARNFLLSAPQRERYDRKRYIQPQNEAEFLAWLKEDVKKHPKNICFQLATQYSLKVLSNIWRLIDSKRLTYGAFEGEKLRNIFWDVIFSDDALTRYVCSEWCCKDPYSLCSNDVSYDVIQCRNPYGLSNNDVSYDFIQFVDCGLHGLQSFEESWQRATDSHEPLAEADRLLLAVLSKNKQPRYRKGVQLYSLTLKPENIHQRVTQASVVALGCKWAVKSIHAYWKKECSFDVLLQHLRFLSEVIFKDCTYSLKMIDRKITVSIQSKMQILSERTDKISQEKVVQLKEVLKEIIQTVQNEFTDWVESNFKQPHQDPCYEVLRTDFNEKTVELHRKVLSVITDYAEKKEIGKNANRIGAFLKWLAYAALFAFTGGVAAIVSQRVRDGLCFRSDTQTKLRMCEKEIAREQKECKKGKKALEKSFSTARLLKVT